MTYIGIRKKTYQGIPASPSERILFVDTTSNSGSAFSPFLLGPCDLYQHPKYGLLTSKNMENAWQYSKLYIDHASLGEPSDLYWDWARAGWSNPRAVRYPMGRGAKPFCSVWKGRQLDYIQARKEIYFPLYASLVVQTPAYAQLKELVNQDKYDEICLFDWDGYDHTTLDLSLSDVLNNAGMKMGHAFVLKALLTNDPVLEEIE
jgi:hypothetical protein